MYTLQMLHKYQTNMYKPELLRNGFVVRENIQHPSALLMILTAERHFIQF